MSVTEVTNKIARIIKGSDVEVTTQLIDRNTKQPFSLEGMTAASAFFANEDDTVLAVTGSLVSADLGKLLFPLNEVQTGGLAEGSEQNMEVVVDQGDVRTIAQFRGGLEILPRLF